MRNQQVRREMQTEKQPQKPPFAVTAGKAWEYRIIPTARKQDFELLPDLNRSGELGWEAVCALPSGDLLMKRRKSA